MKLFAFIILLLFFSQRDYETTRLQDSVDGNALVDSLSCSLVDYYINQINLADSLYKNYLPQYNYDEVKAAVEFFENWGTGTGNRELGFGMQSSSTAIVFVNSHSQQPLLSSFVFRL